MIDYNFFSKYSKEIGFKVAIDTIFNADPSKLYFVVVSLNPPGALYNP